MPFDTKVRDVLAKHFGREMSTITPDARLREDLGADAFDAIEVLQELEEELGATLDETLAARMHTVADVLAYVSSLLGEPYSPTGKTA